MPDKLWRFKPGNKEREKARSSEYYLKNKESISEKRKARYAANRERELERNKKWRSLNLEKSRAICRQWAKDNPLAMRAIVAKRRALLRGATGKYTKPDVLYLLKSQEGICAACSCALSSYHVDHIIPLSRGGSNGPDNIQLLCPTCNRRKSDRTMSEWQKTHQKQAHAQ